MRQIFRSIMVFMFTTTIFSMGATAQSKTFPLAGAWESGTDEIKMTKIFTDQFFSVAIYNVKEKQFIATAGGRWQTDGNSLSETFEYHSSHPDLIGQVVKTPVDVMKNDRMTLMVNNKKEEWKRVDNGTPGKLPGAWLITGRMQDGELQKMTPGARRTMKILSGTHFQWIAYNIDTKEFFGTGGGTYTTENGKYTENILFFSRDNTRVGASLQFDFTLEDGNWRHKGSSSKGDPIDEVWTKREKIGL
jgi:hypothetical protein